MIYSLIRLIIFLPMPGTESRSSMVLNHPLILLNMIIRADLFGPMSGSVSSAFREARLMSIFARFIERVSTKKVQAMCSSIS